MSEFLFHYTKLSTFLEHILPTQKLRFSKLKGSRDPYEYIPRGYYVLSTPDEEIKANHPKIYEKFQESLRCSENSLFLSFCLPSILPSKSVFLEDIIYSGYDKPRMWDQYGDGNQGICLGFNKEKLLNSFSELQDCNKENTDYSFLHSGVTYKSFKNSFFPNTFVSEISDLLHMNQNEWDSFFKEADELFFRKDSDYQDENEYRLLVRTSTVNAPDLYLDIHESLSHIIFGDKVNEKTFLFYNEVISKSVSKHVRIFPTNWCMLEI